MTQRPDDVTGSPQPEAAGAPRPGEPGQSVHPGHVPPVANDPNAAPDTSGVGNMVDEGAPLEPADDVAANAGAEENDPLEEANVRIAGLTNDLQRLQAEYLNYKRRVDRDRELVAQNATFKVLTPIIDVLDTIDRAREHGDLDEGFRAVADQLESVVTGLGLIKFGMPGDPFDPNLHEALSHMGTSSEVTVTTCQQVAKAGYRIGDRVVRAAQVLVVDPADG